jgi:hypothetical protein
MVITDFIHPGISHTITIRIGGPIGGIARTTGFVVSIAIAVDMIAMPVKVVSGVGVRVVMKGISGVRKVMLEMMVPHLSVVMFPQLQPGMPGTRVW